MITMNNNPMIVSKDQPYGIQLAITRETLIDTEIYSKFIYNCENTFRRSLFYKEYKNSLYNKGLTHDQLMAGITSEMVDLELHHHFPTLKQATIMICEHLLNVKGCITTFEVIHELQEAHRRNEMGIVFLSSTNHQNYHSNEGTTFISLKQCIGEPFEFITKFCDGITMDVAFKLLLQLKQEEQYGESFTPAMAKARDEIIYWNDRNSVG